MLWFVLTFLCIYGAMHVLVYQGLKPLLNNDRVAATMLCAWMALMTTAPVTVRLLDRHAYPDAARALAWFGYSWMGLLFLAFCMLLPVFCWDFSMRALQRFRPSLPDLTLRGPFCAAIVLVATLGAGMYGFYEAAYLRVERITLVSDKLPPDTAPIRLVQISDLHLGLMRQRESLTPVITILRHLRPDLLIATGDMVDAQMDHLNGLSDLWRDIDPPLGKFAVTGNHEVYAGLQQSLDFLQRSGFTLLRNRSVNIGKNLLLAGVDDPAVGASPAAPPLPKSAAAKRFRILLKHRPVAGLDTVGIFDLQLSGHAHRGQIFPFNFITGLAYPLQNGLHQLPGGGLLYASRGTGSWGPPMRIGAPPEITLIEIAPAQRR
jgi:predicted MPP superfamily phosphohydrolase